MALGLTQLHVSVPLNHVINQLNITSLKDSFLILSYQFRRDTKVDPYIQDLHIYHSECMYLINLMHSAFPTNHLS